MALKQLSSSNPTSGCLLNSPKAEYPSRQATSNKREHSKLELLLSAGRGTVFGSRNWLVSQNISSAFGVDLEAVKNYNRYLNFEEASASDAPKNRRNIVRLQSKPPKSQKPSAPMSERISRKNSLEKNQAFIISKKEKVNVELVPLSTDSDIFHKKDLEEVSISKLQPSQLLSPAHRRSLTSPSLQSPVSKSVFEVNREPPRIKEQLQRVLRNPLVQTFRKPVAFSPGSPTDRSLGLAARGTRRRSPGSHVRQRPAAANVAEPSDNMQVLKKPLVLDWKNVVAVPVNQQRLQLKQQHKSESGPGENTEEKSQAALFHRECFHTVRKFKRIAESRQYGLADPLAEMLQVQVAHRNRTNQIRCAWAMLFMFVRVLDAIKRKKIMFRVVETFKNYKNIKFEAVVKKAKVVAQQKLPLKVARDQLIVAKTLPLIAILLQKPALRWLPHVVSFMFVSSLRPLQIKAKIFRLKYIVAKLHLAGQNLLKSRALVLDYLQNLWAEAYNDHFSKKNEQPQLLRLMESLRLPACQFIYEYYEYARTTDVMFALEEARNPKHSYSHRFDPAKAKQSISRPSAPGKRYVYDLFQEHLEKHIDAQLSKADPGSASKRARTKSVGTTVSALTSSSKGSGQQKKSSKKGAGSKGNKGPQQTQNLESEREREAGYGCKYTSIPALVRTGMPAPSPVVSCRPFRPLEVFAHLDAAYMSSLIALLHERESKIRSTWGRTLDANPNRPLV